MSNLVFCYFVLHERLGLNDVLGTISIIAGVVICIVANSSGKSKTYTVDELITLMKDGTYITYCGVLALLAVLAYMTYTGDFYAFKLKTGECERGRIRKKKNCSQTRNACADRFFTFPFLRHRRSGGEDEG